jgi:uncharacterized membrane protein YhaH (DUF805 family)
LFLQSQTRPPQWGHLYFAAVLLFGGLYYHLHRGTVVASATETNHRSSAPIDGSAVILVVALLGGLFIEGRERILIAGFYPAIVIVLGFLWFLFRRSYYEAEKAANTPRAGDVNLERIGLWFGLLAGLGYSVVNGLKGWFNIYLGDERYWLGVLWMIFGPAYLVVLLVIGAWMLFRPWPRDFRGDLFPHAYGAIWLVLLVQNVLGQLVTGPPSNWNEVVFNIYYLALFCITGAIVCHYQFVQQCQRRVGPEALAAKFGRIS